jgi:uncharacterized protein (TIGR02996 family)
MTSASLLDALIAAPDDTDRYLVYADALQAAGDPHGELIAIQHARLARPDDDALARAEAELLARHGRKLLRGLDGDLARYELRWHLGFIRSAVVSPREIDRRVLESLTARLVVSRAARLLRNLTIRGRVIEPRDYERALLAVASQPPPLLRRLSLTDRNDGLLDDVDPFPGGRGLEVQTASYSLKRLPSLVAALAPEWLRVDYRETFGDRHLPALRQLIRARLPSLRHLVVRGPLGTVALAQVCIGPLTAQLRSLQVEVGVAEAAELSVLSQYADRLRHLDELRVNVREPPSWGAALRQALPQVRFLDEK